MPKLKIDNVDIADVDPGLAADLMDALQSSHVDGTVSGIEITPDLQSPHVPQDDVAPAWRAPLHPGNLHISIRYRVDT